MNTTEPCRLSRSAEGLQFAGTSLSYRITGLTAYNLDRLRVTLKANPADTPNIFHVDTVDLYNSRGREFFAEACVKYLKAQQGVVMAELSQIIAALEAERIGMREQGSAAQVTPMTDDEKKEALEMLKSKDLLKRIVGDFDGLGFIGEKHNKLLGYIAAVSRLQPDPLALLVLSRSGAGKTSLQDTVCKFVPPEAVIQYTRMTGQSLFYREQNALKNKVLAIEEEDGMREAMYSIKTLISAQKLSIAATRTDAKTGKFSVDEYAVYGPVVVMVSSTNPDALDDETKQRFLILTIDESAEQTKQILQAQISKNMLDWYQTTSDESSVLKLHHNMQRLLKPLIVTFSRELRLVWPYSRLQMRREQQKFVSLVKAITLLHQYQRKTGTMKRVDGSKMEYVQATQKDIDLALELGREVFSRNCDDVSPTGRKLLAEIVLLVNEKYNDLKENDPERNLFLYEIPFLRKELRERIGWSETQVRRNIDQLVELGYVGRVNGRQGSTFRYLLLDDGSADPEFCFGNDLPASSLRQAGGDPKDTGTKNQCVIPKSSPLRHNFVTTSPMA
jgi:DNA primase